MLIRKERHGFIRELILEPVSLPTLLLSVQVADESNQDLFVPSESFCEKAESFEADFRRSCLFLYQPGPVSRASSVQGYGNVAVSVLAFGPQMSFSLERQVVQTD